MNPTNSYLPDFHKVTKTLSWILIAAVAVGICYFGYLGINSLRYRPERIVERFVSLIENPTQTVTDSEKQELKEITQSGFLSSWGNENNIKTLRRISQGNPISHSNISYMGGSKRTATAKLTFQNTLTNPQSKEATLYLERYGNWQSGIKWQIFKIDMPREDSPLDDAKTKADEVQQNLNEGTKGILDKINEFLGK